MTPFQGVAAMADGASLVTNWGDKGVEYINTDITLALAAVPQVSRSACRRDRVEHDGIAVGTAAVFDRTGPLGTAVVTSLVNAHRTVDFDGVEYGDDGERRRAREPSVRGRGRGLRASRACGTGSRYGRSGHRSPP